MADMRHGIVDGDVRDREVLEHGIVSAPSLIRAGPDDFGGGLYPRPRRQCEDGAMSEERNPTEMVRVPVGGLTGELAAQGASLLQELVARGAPLGWVEPPPTAEVENLLREVAEASTRGDACLVAAIEGDALVGLGYWRRYSRPTHRPHADVEKVAVASDAQGRHVGRRIMEELLEAARDARIEVVTLDLRADNHRAAALYASLGFERYGALPRFVAVGAERYDKHFYALDLRSK